MKLLCWVVVFAGLTLAGAVRAEELPPLGMLKAAALKNNLGLKVKEGEFAAVEAQSSLLNNVKITSSYNFETNTTFYGATLSIPFGFFADRRKYLAYKKTGLEEARRDILTQVEEVYSDYEVLRRQTEIYEVELKEAELEFMLAKEGFAHDRIEKAELIRAEKVFKETLFELFKINQDTELLKRKLYRLSGVNDGKTN